MGEQFWLVPHTTGWKLAMSPQIMGGVGWSYWWGAGHMMSSLEKAGSCLRNPRKAPTGHRCLRVNLEEPFHHPTGEPGMIPGHKLGPTRDFLLPAVWMLTVPGEPPTTLIWRLLWSCLVAASANSSLCILFRHLSPYTGDAPLDRRMLRPWDS